MSERVLTPEQMAGLRCELAAAERQLDAACDVMDFDPEDVLEGTEQMRLAAARMHLHVARSYVEAAS